MSTNFNHEQMDDAEEDKTQRVINALENPKFEWRTIAGVSKETQLPPSEVEEILSKLGKKIMKSTAKGRSVYTTRDYYTRRKYKGNAAEQVFIDRTDQAINQLSEADPKEIQKITALQTVVLREYYLLALEQAKQSFRWALIAAIVGLVFFLGAIAFLLTIQSQSLAIVNVICGAMVEAISGINFYLYGQTSKQLAHYHRQLDQTQRFLLANSVCESLEGESRQKARSDLVSLIATFGVEQPQTTAPGKQRNEKR